MDKKQISLMMKWLNVIILIAGILFLVFSGYALYTTLNLEAGKSVSYRAGEGLNKQAGTFAEIAGIAAGVLWLIRTVMMKAKGYQNLKEWLRPLYMVLRKHHIFLGITTLVVAFIHGLYFWLFRNVDTNIGPRDRDTTWNFYSGIVSFLALAVLAALGWNHQVKKATKQNRKTKMNHIIAALVFGFLALIHIYII